jgi:hypothetical protein
MAGFIFEREVRTETSECYTILEDDQPIGRVDIHFSAVVVHATLCVEESLTRDRIHDLVEVIDEELVNSIGVSREEFIVHVHQGTDLGIFSTADFDDDDEDEGV